MLTEDQVQGLCVQCGKNKQTPRSKSKAGFKRFSSLCSSCTKKKYGLDPGPAWRRGRSKLKKDSCERCGFKGDLCQLDIHHINRKSRDNRPENVITLCANCHRLEHKGEFA